MTPISAIGNVYMFTIQAEWGRFQYDNKARFPITWRGTVPGSFKERTNDVIDGQCKCDGELEDETFPEKLPRALTHTCTSHASVFFDNVFS